MEVALEDVERPARAEARKRARQHQSTSRRRSVRRPHEDAHRGDRGQDGQVGEDAPRTGPGRRRPHGPAPPRGRAARAGRRAAGSRGRSRRDRRSPRTGTSGRRRIGRCDERSLGLRPRGVGDQRRREGQGDECADEGQRQAPPRLQGAEAPDDDGVDHAVAKARVTTQVSLPNRMSSGSSGVAAAAWYERNHLTRGEHRPERLAFAELHGGRREQAGRDEVQVRLTLDESGVLAHQMTDADAEGGEEEDGEQDGARDRTAPRLGVADRVVPPTAPPARASRGACRTCRHSVHQRPAGQAEKDVLERTASHQRARRRDAAACDLTQGVVALVDVEQHPVGQHLDALGEGRQAGRAAPRANRCRSAARRPRAWSAGR